VSETRDIAAPLPWQEALWQRFDRALNAKRSPHALLLAGPQGLGKFALAKAMAARVLCDNPQSGFACGQCRGCLLRMAGSHPDYTLIEPEAGGSGILKIEAIRALTAFSQRTSQYNRYRVAILSPAEAMNKHTANALLKTLEEPPASVLLILVSHRPGILPATIRSRCQLHRVSLPRQAEALNWLQEQGFTAPEAVLKLAGGAPLAAAQLADERIDARFQTLISAITRIVQRQASPVAIAADWQAVGALETTTLMQRLALELARWQAAPAQSDRLSAAITPIAKAMPIKRLHRIADRLTQLRGAATQSLSRELSLEALFLLWSRP
jgi:DNA polymerase-3 subunit delta'